jgi:hypothetical protein
MDLCIIHPLAYNTGSADVNKWVSIVKLNGKGAILGEGKNNSFTLLLRWEPQQEE